MVLKYYDTNIYMVITIIFCNNFCDYKIIVI